MFNALSEAVKKALDDPSAKLVEATYTMFATNQGVQQATLERVQQIDKDLQRLESELNAQVGVAMELREEIRAKDQEIKELRENALNKP